MRRIFMKEIFKSLNKTSLRSTRLKANEAKEFSNRISAHFSQRLAENYYGSHSALNSFTTLISKSDYYGLFKAAKSVGTIKLVNRYFSTVAANLNDFDSISNACLKSLKDEYVKSFYSKFGSNEKEFLENRFAEFFEHAVYGGKMTRSRLSFSVFQLLKAENSLIDSKSALKVILSIELLQAVFLVIDDVMDGAETRRGKTCWHKMPSVGMAALNHSLRLQNFVNISILNAIPTHQNLGEILKTAWETVQVTYDGQELDGFSSKASECTFERYSHIVANKTSRYTFYYPITVAFLLANENKYLDQVLDLSEDLGYFFQAQDDLLDFKDDNEVTGKTCCDIREGKCTWFSCKTMEKLSGNLEKKREFEECYGSSDPAKVSKAKKIMDECNLIQDFKIFQEEMIVKINQKIDEFPIENVKVAFRTIFNSLINRKK